MPIPPSSAVGGAPPAIPHDALVQQKQGQATMIWSIGAFCIFGWELLLCLPKEYRLIWRKPINFSSILYIVNRYFGALQLSFVVSLISNAWSSSACSPKSTSARLLNVFLFEPVGALISTVLSQMILGSRVYAIYGQSKAVAMVLLSILAAETVIGGISISTTSPRPPVPGPPTSQPPCGALMGPFGWLIAFWTIPLLYDSLTFLLTAWKAYDFWKKEVDTPLFDVIWRDGLLYFFAIFTMNAANVIIFLTVPEGLRPVNLTPTLILEIVLSCRLILNLRGSHSRTNSRPYQAKGSSGCARLRSESNPNSSGEEKTVRQFEETAVKLQLIRKVDTYNSDIKVAPLQGTWNRA